MIQEETGYLINKYLSEERLNEAMKWHRFYNLCDVEPVSNHPLACGGLK